MTVKKALLVVGFASISAVGIATAQTEMGIRSQIVRELDRWKTQQVAAERDVQLTQSVLVNFFTATNPPKGQPKPASVNAAIQPLVLKFPDYRLHYRTVADYCPIFRAISEARRSALSRQSQALYRQVELLRIEQIHGSMFLLSQADSLTGKTRNPADVDRVFQREISGIGAEPTKLGWGEWDYLSINLPPADHGRDCN